jgi:hypothetical protein
MLAQELEEVRQQSHQATQNVISVNTNIKGLVLVKIMRSDLCPVKLVETIFQRVKDEKRACSRHLARLIPLQYVFYPDESELMEHMYEMLQAEFPTWENPLVVAALAAFAAEKKRRLEPDKTIATEQGDPAIIDSSDLNDAPLPGGDESASKRAKPDDDGAYDGGRCDALGEAITSVLPVPVPLLVLDVASVPSAIDDVSMSVSPFKSFAYNVNFKARNHNVLQKKTVYDVVHKCMPSFARRVVHSSCNVSFRSLKGEAVFRVYEGVQLFSRVVPRIPSYPFTL